MTPCWCLLYRVTHSDGRVVECGGRSWAETADAAANQLRDYPLAAGVTGYEVVAVLPWASEHYTSTTAELFAVLKAGTS